MNVIRYTHEVTIENYEVAEARRELESERLIEGEAPASPPEIEGGKVPQQPDPTVVGAAPSISGGASLGEGTDTKAESSRGAARVTPPSLNHPEILEHNTVPFREANLLAGR